MLMMMTVIVIIADVRNNENGTQGRFGAMYIVSCASCFQNANYRRQDCRLFCIRFCSKVNKKLLAIISC